MTLALWLADVLVAAGLDVHETPGWTLRGKPMDAIEGVFAHHTASPVGSTLATNLAVVTNGNGVAPGPVAQLLIWRDGSCHVIAAGKANHAGAGGPIPGWLPLSPPGQLSVGNARCIGIEAVNDGVGEVWSNDLLDAFEIATAAILKFIGADESRTVTHHEWAPTRKIDPAGPTGGRIATLPGRLTWDPNAWRERVGLRLLVNPPEPAPPVETPPPVPALEEDDEMAEKLKFIGVEGSPSQYLWRAGIDPIGLVNPVQRDIMLAMHDIDPTTGKTISAEQFNQLH